MNILPVDFYQRDTVIVAKELLGKVLVREIAGVLIVGIIIETEAYGAGNDKASHAYKGKTNRNAAMFGPVGHAYVYFIYGVHYCLNVVARDSNVLAGAVLIRGLAIHGIAKKENLCNGPGKLAKTLSIDLSFNGVDMMQQGSLYVIDRQEPLAIKKSSRIGISKERDLQWRFFIK